MTVTDRVGHSDQKLRRMFDELRARHENKIERGKKLLIVINGRLGGYEAQLGGMFSPPKNGRDSCVRVRFYRDHQAVPGPALDEVWTLADELGHWRSWAGNERPSGYDELVAADARERWSDLPEVSRMVIFDEVRAWQHGRRLAAEVGFEDWVAYVKRAQQSLRTYCEKLGLPPELADGFET